MPSTTIEAQMIPMLETVEIPDEIRCAFSRPLDQPPASTFETERVKPTEHENEPLNVSDVKRTHRWNALDRLLLNSFGVISPAYLFISFPLIH